MPGIQKQPTEAKISQSKKMITYATHCVMLSVLRSRKVSSMHLMKTSVMTNTGEGYLKMIHGGRSAQ
jgi:predicted GH43/DUF377 family glycosyl hydrolase